MINTQFCLSGIGDVCTELGFQRALAGGLSLFAYDRAIPTDGQDDVIWSVTEQAFPG